MGFDWLRRQRPRKTDRAQCRAIVAELSERYDVAELDAGRSVQVVVEDAFEQDEAVVQLASQFDEIDVDWQRYLSWPRSAA